MSNRFLFKILFILFLAVLALCCYTGSSLVAVSRGYSQFSLQWLLLLQSMGSRVPGRPQLQLPGSRAQAQQLWRAGLAAPWHVGSSRIRDRTLVSCIGRQTLPLSYQGSPDKLISKRLYHFSLPLAVFKSPQLSIPLSMFGINRLILADTVGIKCYQYMLTDTSLITNSCNIE